MKEKDKKIFIKLKKKRLKATKKTKELSKKKSKKLLNTFQVGKGDSNLKHWKHRDLPFDLKVIDHEG